MKYLVKDRLDELVVLLNESKHKFSNIDIRKTEFLESLVHVNTVVLRNILESEKKAAQRYKYGY